MREKSRPLLKKQDVRRSLEKKSTTVSSIQIKKQDAFNFLAELKPASVDLFVSSPPYCMGKAYETSINATDFIQMHERLAPLLVRALKEGGSVCWQVGHQSTKG
jgi:adenine-specific DNA-methyltransferase